MFGIEKLSEKYQLDEFLVGVPSKQKNIEYFLAILCEDGCIFTVSKSSYCKVFLILENCLFTFIKQLEKLSCII